MYDFARRCACELVCIMLSTDARHLPLPHTLSGKLTMVTLTYDIVLAPRLCLALSIDGSTSDAGRHWLCSTRCLTKHSACLLASRLNMMSADDMTVTHNAAASNDSEHYNASSQGYARCAQTTSLADQIFPDMRSTPTTRMNVTPKRLRYCAESQGRH